MKHRIQFLRRRREFIALLGGVAAACPLAGHAEQAAKVYTIGVLALTAPNPDRLLAALRQGLREAGYIEGRNLRLEIRTADARPELAKVYRIGITPCWRRYRSCVRRGDNHSNNLTQRARAHHSRL